MAFGLSGFGSVITQMFQNAAQTFSLILGGAFSGMLGFLEATLAAQGSGFNILVPVTRANGSLFAVGVSYSFVDGTAVNGVDYVGTPGTLSWANGDTATKYISVTFNRVTTSKSFTIVLSNPTGGASLDATKDELAVTIIPVANQNGVLGFRQLTQQQLAGQVMTIPVYRTDGGVGAVSVQYATANGTGSAGVDYQAASGTLNWANGDVTEKNILVTLLSPATDKTFLVNLSNPTGGAITNPDTDQMTGTIIGTGLLGNPGEFAFEFLTYQVGESTTLPVKVKRLNGKAGAVTVDYDTANGTASAGTNYTLTSGTLNWADQDDADKTINIPILTVNFPATFTIGLNTPTGGASIQSGQETAEILILNSAMPTPVQQLSDVYVDGPLLAVAGESFVELPNGYLNTNSFVRFWEALGGDVLGDPVLGFAGGNPGFSNGLDNVSADETLLPTSPFAIQLNRFIVPSS